MKLLFYITFIFCLACTNTTNYNSNSLYIEGDIIALSDQIKEFTYCYPQSFIGESFSFLENVGRVFMIEMSATW